MTYPTNTQATDALAPQYDPAATERGVYARWEQEGYFAISTDKTESFSIVLPPPNVTGSLHMGHGFNNTIMDALTRYHRMQGKNTLWQPGTDHAGIATQMVVERQLAAEGLDRKSLGREVFLDKVWQWKSQSGGTISQQIRRMGSSVDWSRERFTMDNGLSEVVKEVFVRLYEQGLIYRGKRLVNWDVKLQTAISDLEVENRDEQGQLYHIRYPFVAGQGLDGQFMHIATTRPETMLADACLAVHPSDERYRAMIGKLVQIPLSGRIIPIIADPYPDPAFGTGCVKITPAHDFNDYEVGRRHELEMISIMNLDGTMNANAPEAYQGLDRFLAREKIVDDLRAQGFLEKTEAHALKRPYGDRSGVVIEPLLTDQWYVSIAPLAAPAIAAVEDGRIEFIPTQYKNMYMAWMRDVQDWCISRQLWWGHRIPAWYDEVGDHYVGRSESEVRKKYQLPADLPLRQDEDVLDTWFSSALWTFSTLGWTGDGKKDATNAILHTFHPTSVLVTGFDIIFFWVARMIMLTMHFIKNADGSPQIPFKSVYVHGLVRDSFGQKMSKSKGNVIDPIDLIDGIALPDLIQKRTTGLLNPKDAAKIAQATTQEFPDGIPAFGTDALRFTFCALANTGRDISFDLKRIEGYRNFCTKIWNAARFVLMQSSGKPIASAADPALWQLPEHWIMHRLQEVIAELHGHFANYRLDLVANAVYDFIWNDYCDWYVEFAKAALNHKTTATDDGVYDAQVRYILLTVLETALRMMHPLMPFISETLWQTIAPQFGKKDAPSIMLSCYPRADSAYLNTQSAQDMDWLQNLIKAVRHIRAQVGVGNAILLPVLIQNLPTADVAKVQRISPLLTALAKVERLEFLPEDRVPPPVASAMIGQVSVLVPLQGLIDPTAELNRLKAVQDKLNQQISALTTKLANAGFTTKAPAAVVDAERKKLSQAQEQNHATAVLIAQWEQTLPNS